MKKIIILLSLLFSLFTYSQEDIVLTEIEEVEEVEDDSPMKVPFSIVEQIPIYKGCDESLNKSELKKCMSDGISKHVTKKFKTKIANRLELSQEKIKVLTLFDIDTKGNIVNIKCKAPHPDLEKEAIRVIKLLPKMKKPGYQRKEAVIVTYYFPLVFNVENIKTSKK